MAEKLYLPKRKYIENVLERLRIKDYRLASTPIFNHFKLSSKNYLKSKEENVKMFRLLYASTMGSMM